MDTFKRIDNGGTLPLACKEELPSTLEPYGVEMVGKTRSARASVVIIWDLSRRAFPSPRAGNFLLPSLQGRRRSNKQPHTLIVAAGGVTFNE